MPAEWRWLRGPNDRPFANMAIDQAIFEAHAAGIAPATIRVYTWGLPAVTIGRLQSEVAARAEFPGLRCIRRPTGGRAVVHGSDLTIAVAVKEDMIRPLLSKRGVLASYFLFLEPVIATLREYGVCVGRGSLESAGTLSRVTLREQRATLNSHCGIDRKRPGGTEDCFARIAPCDLVDQQSGVKILGSAQRRAGGAILQQMSLPPLQKVQIAGDEFEERLRHNFTEALRVGSFSTETELSARENKRAIEIEREQSTDLIEISAQ